MSYLAQNIRFLREKAGLTQTQFADIFKCSRNNVVSYEINTVPKLELLISIVKYFNTNVEEIYTADLSEEQNITLPTDEKQNVVANGSSDSSTDSKSESSILHTPQESKLFYKGNIDHNMIDVPLIDIGAAANSTSGFLAPYNPETIDHIIIPASMIRKGRQNYAFRVINDSMEPTLYMDDIIIVTHVEPSNYDQLKEDRVCVVVSKSKGVLVKRIRNRLESSKLIRCRSDNKFYHSFNIYAEDLLNIFEVRCKISFNLPNEMSNIYDMYRKLEDRIEDLEERQKPR